MKSLVEEASSVSKAIEKAWIRAGKPTSFSVKIYEEAQSGFLGFNSKPAKIGLFFEEFAHNKAQNENRKRHHAPHTDEQKDTERRPSHHGSRDRNGHNGQRSSSRPRRPQQSFEKKEFDRGERSERPERHERRRPAQQSFEKKEQQSPSQTTFIPEPSAAPKQPEQSQPAQQPTARRVLKVSSRRYSAPKQESTPAAPVPTSNDDDSTK